MRLGGLFGSSLGGKKPLASAPKTPAQTTQPGPSNLAAALPKKPKYNPNKPFAHVTWPKAPPQQVKDYKPILTLADLEAYLARCEATGRCGFDWETTANEDTRQRWADYVADYKERRAAAEITDPIDKEYDEKRKAYLRSPLDPHKGEICTVSLSAAPHEARVVPIDHRRGKVFEPRLTREAARKLVMDTLDRKLFRLTTVKKVAVNISFETKYAARHEKYIMGPVSDPLVMWVRCLQLVAPEKLIDPERPNTGWGLKPATKHVFGVEMMDFMALLEKHGVEFFDELDASGGEGLKYSAEDADYALQQDDYWMQIAQQIELPADCPNRTYADWLLQIEMPFGRVIGLMEYWGMRWDENMAAVKAQEAELAQEAAAEGIRKLALDLFDLEINPGKTGKTNDVKHLLFEHMKVPAAKWSEKTSDPSLDEEAIIDMRFILDNKLESLDEEKYLAVELPEGWEQIEVPQPFEVPDGMPTLDAIAAADAHRNKYAAWYDLGKDEQAAIRIARRDPHPHKDAALKLLDLMVTIQKYSTLLGTHVRGREKYLNEVTGRIHAGYGPWTQTARLSSFSPNGQNVPRPDNDTLGVRGFYVPGPGKILFFIDFNGFELRIMAWKSDDETMIELFRTGGDMHRKTASVLAEKPEDQVTKKERTDAKPGNFGISYGGTEHSLQKTYKTDYGMRKTLDFCAKVVAAVKAAYPGIPRFQRSIALDAREKGWVGTIYGYIRPLPGINSTKNGTRSGAERQAANTPIQGTAADVMKARQNEVYDEIGRGTALRYDYGKRAELAAELWEAIQSAPLWHGGTDMIAQIHDEMIFEMDDDPATVAAAEAWIKRCMEQPPIAGFPVPIEAESSVGYRWNDKKSVSDWLKSKGVNV